MTTGIIVGVEECGTISAYIMVIFTGTGEVGTIPDIGNSQNTGNIHFIEMENRMVRMVPSVKILIEVSVKILQRKLTRAEGRNTLEDRRKNTIAKAAV